MKGKDAIPLLIVVGLSFVNRAIDFHDQPRLMAIEVDDESIDDLLTSGVEAL